MKSNSVKKIDPSGKNEVKQASSVSGSTAKLLHDRIRLAIVSALAVNNVLGFGELKSLVDTTDGNLSVHARKLEDAKYITSKKGYRDRKPRTEYKLTAKGRRELLHYLDHMEALINRVRNT